MLQGLNPGSPPPNDVTLMDSKVRTTADQATADKYRVWLQQLQALCTECKIALIFDEVYTGFRMAVGGAQEFYGVQADMVVYGKTLGGGMPSGVVCGRRELMQVSPTPNPDLDPNPNPIPNPTPDLDPDPDPNHNPNPNRAALRPCPPDAGRLRHRHIRRGPRDPRCHGRLPRLGVHPGGQGGLRHGHHQDQGLGAGQHGMVEVPP